MFDVKIGDYSMYKDFGLRAMTKLNEEPQK